MYTTYKTAILFFVLPVSIGVKLLQSCEPGFFLDPSRLQCTACPLNASMVTSSDGFGCSCDDNSVPVDATRCKRCNTVELLSEDGTSCVPRRCQKDKSGQLACRKCPADYLVVTQNFDGSPFREVQCVRCTRGYRSVGGRCVKCQDCVCGRNQVPYYGVCIPRDFIAARYKTGGTMKPNAMSDVVKYEYLCINGDMRSCRSLANKCIKSLYSSDHGGPCRLWLQDTTMPRPMGLPELVFELTASDGLNPGEVRVPHGQDELKLILLVHSNDGGVKLLSDPANTVPYSLPITIKIGFTMSYDYELNITQLLELDDDTTLAPYLQIDDKLFPVAVTVRVPGGELVPSERWKTGQFLRYFLVHKPATSKENNITTGIFLKTSILHLRVQRDVTHGRDLIIRISLEVQYENMNIPMYSKSTRVSLRLEQKIPDAGVRKSLEIWGGVLGAMSALYAVVQWRGACRRGAVPTSLCTILAGSVADALYVSAMMSALSALASEVGATGVALPLSSSEETMLAAFLHSVIAFKILRVGWLNWRQCRCDIFLLDWTEYGSSLKGEGSDIPKEENWRRQSVGREWLSMQAERRVSPGYTAVLALLIFKLIRSWEASLPISRGYRCAIAAGGWWISYIIVAASRWIHDRILGSPADGLPRVCRASNVSLLVFQEELYAHYVHGRNGDPSDLRSLTGPLAACRLICAPQLRVVYKQLSTPTLGAFVDNTSRRAVLTRLFAAFFERALDGLSWVASERSFMERLLDVELIVRENGSTSALLYDLGHSSASCLILTWWGEECNLAMFDGLLFTSAILWGADAFLATLITLIVWQVMRYVRRAFGKNNFRVKTEINVY